jgi:hypothetical protein
MRDPHVLVVWQGRVGDHSPYADCSGLSAVQNALQ